MGGALLGIDLRAGDIRLATLRRAGKGWEMQHFAALPAPDGGPVQLKAAVEQFRPGVREAVLVLGYQHALIRRHLLPRMAPGRLRALVEREQDRYIPFWGEGANFDLHVLRSSKADRQMDVLLAAVPSRLILPLQQACRAAGLRLAAVDLDLSALLRAAVAAGALASVAGLAAVVEVEGATVRVGLFENGVLVAGRGLTTEAESAAEVAVEVRRSLEVLLAQQPAEARLGGLALVGDVAGGGLAGELAALLRTDVGGRLDPAFAVNPVVLPDGSGAVAAFGAALAREAAPRPFHLLPRTTLEQRRQRARNLLMGMAGAAAVSTYGWYWSVSVPEAHLRLERAETALVAAQADLKRRAEVEQLEKRRRELEMVLADLRVSETPMYQVIPGIRALAPPGLEVTDVGGQVPNLSVKGQASHPSQVAELLGRLAAAPYVAGIELRTVSQVNGSQYSYDISVTLRGQKRGTVDATTQKSEP
ncbi:MAG TPA: pilus assembly protein PilM [Symbiobacteriaceae bacterium]|nr:pilus assembly protein PilM [Symbiobacteriaceae bacterium]